MAYTVIPVWDTHQILTPWMDWTHYYHRSDAQGVPVACSHKRKRKCRLLAIQILGGAPIFEKKMREYKKKMAEAVEARTNSFEAIEGAEQ